MDELVAFLRAAVDADAQMDDGVRGYCDDSAHPTNGRWAAEIEAKRQRIDLLAEEWRYADQDVTGDWVSYAIRDLTEQLLKLEAQLFADRPGFKGEWRLT